jgi:hypothetical protein
MGILCIRRSLAEGLLAGLLTGLGAATADALYGCVAGFVLTLISKILIGNRPDRVRTRGDINFELTPAAAGGR